MKLVKCPTCRAEFRQSRSNRRYCTESCSNRARKIRRRYNLEPEEVVAMYKQQQGRCAICRIKGDVTEMGFTEKTTLVIDHSHKTGNVRGLLCYKCNSGLGMFKDSKKSLSKAIDYLKNKNRSRR